MVNDSNSAHLIFRSEAGQDSDQIAAEIGIRSNWAIPEKPNGSRVAFGLHSELAINERLPMIDHMNWLIGQCCNNMEEIRSFLKKPGNTG